MEAANAETFLILQIETPEGLACVEEIAAVPGVDGFFIGPGDLSLRLKCVNDWNASANGRRPSPGGGGGAQASHAGRRRRHPGLGGGHLRIIPIVHAIKAQGKVARPDKESVHPGDSRDLVDAGQGLRGFDCRIRKVSALAASMYPFVPER